MSMLEQVKDARAAADSEYAAERPKIDAIERLIDFRIAQGFTQAEVARRMGVPAPRVSVLESKPWDATWERVHAYAKALGVDFVLIFPPFERCLEAKIGGAGVNVDAVGTKLRELATLLEPLTHT